MKTEGIVAFIAFIIVIVGGLIIFNFNGFTNVNWTDVFNIKTYPK
jgi:hypothetical protein